jgi:hypothetical protein
MTGEPQDQQAQHCTALNVVGHDVRLLRFGEADGYSFFLKIDGAIYGSPYSSQVNALEAAYRLLDIRGFSRVG